MALIYHLASRADWDRARVDGEYRTSTRGRTLAEEGFIHASTAGQVAGVANRFYADAGELVLLVIDTDLLTVDLRFEQVPGEAEPFPHLYGPLDVAAVVDVRPFAPDSDGTYRFPASG